MSTIYPRIDSFAAPGALPNISSFGQICDTHFKTTPPRLLNETLLALGMFDRVADSPCTTGNEGQLSGTTSPDHFEFNEESMFRYHEVFS